MNVVTKYNFYDLKRFLESVTITSIPKVSGVVKIPPNPSNPNDGAFLQTNLKRMLLERRQKDEPYKNIYYIQIDNPGLIYKFKATIKHSYIECIFNKMDDKNNIINEIGRYPSNGYHRWEINIPKLEIDLWPDKNSVTFYNRIYLPQPKIIDESGYKIG